MQTIISAEMHLSQQMGPREIQTVYPGLVGCLDPSRAGPSQVNQALTSVCAVLGQGSSVAP